MVYYKKRIQIEISQAKHIEQSPEKVPNAELLVILPPWRKESVISLELMCDNTHRVVPTGDAHLSLGVQSVYWGLCHIGTDCSRGWSVSSPSIFKLILHDPKSPPWATLLVWLKAPNHTFTIWLTQDPQANKVMTRQWLRDHSPISWGQKPDFSSSHVKFFTTQKGRV